RANAPRSEQAAIVFFMAHILSRLQVALDVAREPPRRTGSRNGSPGTIGGGVRTLSATNAAPPEAESTGGPSARSVAISAPLFPAPPTAMTGASMDNAPGSF